MMAVTTGGEFAGGSRLGSGTVWLQMVAGRSRTGSADGCRAAPTAGGTPWAACAGEACTSDAAARATSNRTRTRIGVGDFRGPALPGRNAPAKAKPRVYWI